MQSAPPLSGWNWYVEGFGLVKKNFGVLLAYFLISVGIGIFSSVIPAIGAFVFALITPVLFGGIFYAIDRLDKNQSIDIGMLFQGFKDSAKTGPLIICGVLLMIVQLAVGGLIGLLVLGPALSGLAQDQAIVNPLMIFSNIGLLGILIMLLLSALVIMMFMYAIPLIMLRDYAPVNAVKESFTASLNNVPALLVFGVIYMIASFFAALPFMLGFLFLIPLMFCTAYASFKEVFSTALVA